jgi:fused signal recognition particle receptor
MFDFLKKKIKESVKKISEVIAPKKPKKKEKPVKEKIKRKKKIKREEPVKEEKVGLLEKLTTKKITDKEFEQIFKPLELPLLESNIAFEVTEKLKDELREELQKKRMKRGKETSSVKNALSEAFDSILIEPDLDKFWNHFKKKPTKIMFVGVNGVGKTTSLAKFCHMLKKKGKSVVLAASDTFRAASIEQLEKHSGKLRVKVIKHKYGSDAAAVAFDTVKHAESKEVDVVLIDTAGRSHANVNLMDEVAKIKRVVDPDITIFVGDSLTGNDAVEQAKSFNDKLGIDYSILAKADVDQKGGAIVSVGYVTKKPILFLGTGQEYKDLEFFKKEKILEKLGLDKL